MRRTTTPVLAALVAATVLSGCGGSDEPTPATSSSSSSSEPGSGYGAPAGGAGGTLFASMVDAMAEAGTAKVNLDISSAGQQIEGAGSYRLEDGTLEADLQLDVAGQGAMRVVLLAGALYLKLPQGSELVPGKPWLVIEPGASDPFSQAFGPLLEQLQGALDPSQGLSFLQAASTLEEDGSETIDGVETTRYQASLDLAKVAEVSSGAVKEQYEQLVAAGVTTLDFTLWVDGDDRPVKFDTVVPTEAGDVSATGTYSDWGEPVDIEAPPKGEVATSGDLGSTG